jgi:hypothetical protein
VERRGLVPSVKTDLQGLRDNLRDTKTTREKNMRNYTDSCGQQWVDNGMGWVPLGVSQEDRLPGSPGGGGLRRVRR